MVFVPLKNIGLLLRKAREDDVNETDFIVELAGFGATFALMTQNDPLAVARAIEQRVMSEPDDEDDADDDDL